MNLFGHRRLLLLSTAPGAVMAVMLALVGCVTPAPPPAATTPAGEAGRQVYVRKCASCHRFYDPARYTPAAWAGWMEKMAVKSRLSAEERAALEAYLDPFRPAAGR